MGLCDVKPMDNNVGAYYYLTKYLYKQRNFKHWTFRPFALMSTNPYIGNRYQETSLDYHKSKGNLITTFFDRPMVLPRIYKEKFPQYLIEPTKKKLQEERDKKEKKLLISTHPTNYHPDILEIVKNWQKQVKYEQELNDFKQLLL